MMSVCCFFCVVKIGRDLSSRLTTSIRRFAMLLSFESASCSMIRGFLIFCSSAGAGTSLSNDSSTSSGADSSPVEILKWKEIYQGLEDACDECKEFTHVLGNIVVKNA